MTTRIGILKEKESRLIHEFTEVIRYMDHMQGYQGVLSDTMLRRKQEIEAEIEKNRARIQRLQSLE